MPEFGGKIPNSLADRVLIVKSRTGSGKSTTLPVNIFRLLRNEKTPIQDPYMGRSVLCTQPRVVTAITLARDMSAAKYYPDMVLGKTVGFQTGPVTEKPLNGLVYATAGVLLAQLRFRSDDELMSRYACIIIDEAHERSLDTDSILMMLKNFLQRSLGRGGNAIKQIPLIVLASATIDVAKYASFFKIGHENIVVVEGRQFPIEMHWPPHGFNNYIDAAIETTIKIHNENLGDGPDQADILIFMPGGAEIKEVASRLLQYNHILSHEEKPLMMVLSIDREVINREGRDFRLMKEDLDSLWVRNGLTGSHQHPLRRVVVSTVVAETGLTIETLKYVIDSGWSRNVEIYHPQGYKGLITRPTAQSRVEQRKGRVGRLFPGHFYPLYTEKVFGQLLIQQHPDIITEGPAAIILDVIREQLAVKRSCAQGRRQTPEFRVEDMDMLDVPPVDALVGSIEKALVAGFISDHVRLDPDGNEKGYGLTTLGLYASRFARMSIEEARLIFSAYLWEVSISDAAILIAIAQVAEKGLSALFSQETRRNAQTKSGKIQYEGAIWPGVPEFIKNMRHSGETGSQTNDSPAELIDQVRLGLSDDLLEGLLIYEGFRRQITDQYQRDNFGVINLSNWCEENGLSFEAMIKITIRREEVIDDLITAGLNPFQYSDKRLALSEQKNFMSRVVSLKRCVYEAFRLTLLTGAGLKYYDRFNEEIKVPSFFKRFTGLKESHFEESWRPGLMVTPQILVQAVKSDFLQWRLEAPLISVLDGYVNVDSDIVAPRIPYKELLKYVGGEDSWWESSIPYSEKMLLRKYFTAVFGEINITSNSLQTSIDDLLDKDGGRLPALVPLLRLYSKGSSARIRNMRPFSRYIPYCQNFIGLGYGTNAHFNRISYWLNPQKSQCINIDRQNPSNFAAKLRDYREGSVDVILLSVPSDGTADVLSEIDRVLTSQGAIIVNSCSSSYALNGTTLFCTWIVALEKLFSGGLPLSVFNRNEVPCELTDAHTWQTIFNAHEMTRIGRVNCPVTITEKEWPYFYDIYTKTNLSK